MNKYMEEFREMLLEFQYDFPVHGQVFYMEVNELKNS